ncbi:MAG: IPT/TIG domain-containing protein [Nitrospiraceae bacterium]
MQSLMIALVLLFPIAAPGDQAQYFYDELGRLVGVVDGSGNVAVYNYDAVGNLLSVQRFTTGATGIGIFLVAPNSARVGTNVTIQGFGFTTPPSSNQLAFNGTSATVVSATTTSLVATVPTGATTGPVTVTNANGTATSPSAFTVLVPPIIAGIDPARVPQGATTRLVIEGFNLANASAVTFSQSGLSATILLGGTSQNLPINLTVSSTVPVGSYPFSVTTPAGTTQSGTVTVAVTPPVPSFGVANPLSVFKPFPTQTPPSGPSFSVAPPVSVSMP